jgi:hypothetical protein
MTKKLLFVTTILLVVVCVAFAADITGKWTYQMAGRQGGDPVPVTITLKADGAKLTGSVPGGMGGRGGGGGGTPPAPTEITNGKIDGANVYFEVSRPGRQGGDPTVIKYEGSFSGDELKLKITTPGRQGGDPRVQDVVAKREKS